MLSQKLDSHPRLGPKVVCRKTVAEEPVAESPQLDWSEWQEKRLESDERRRCVKDAQC